MIHTINIKLKDTFLYINVDQWLITLACCLIKLAYFIYALVEITDWLRNGCYSACLYT